MEPRVDYDPVGGPSRSPRSRVVRGFAGILGGSSLAQLLALCALPVLSRLYTPSDNAHYALLLSIGAVIASFASLRLDLAVPIPHEIQDSRSLFWLAALTPLVVLPIVAAFAGVLYMAGVWRVEELEWYDFLAVAVFVVVVRVFSSASQLAIRLRSYGVLSRVPILQMAGTLGTQVTLGFIGFSRGLFIGGLIGRSLGILRLVRSCDVGIDQVPDRQAAVRLLKRFWRFPVIFTPAALLESLGSNLVPMMLPWLFGFNQAGLFAMAVRVVGLPGGVISQAAGQVFLGEFARASSRAAAVRTFLRWSVVLLLLAILVAGATWVLSPILMPWVLGPSWDGIVPIVQLAGVMTGAAIFCAPFHHVWTVRQRGLMQFTWNLMWLVSTASVIWYGAQSGDSLNDVVGLLTFVTVLLYLVSWVMCLVAAARPASRGWEDAHLK